MIELVFVSCLAAAPDQCRTQSLLYAPETGLLTCMIHGQTEIARWSETHPGQIVHDWKCRMVDTREVRA